MNKFEITEKEKEFISEIHRCILNSNEISYVIGIDRINGKRRIFQVYMDKSVDPPVIYATAEILQDNRSVIEEVIFEFSQENESQLQYKERPWYHKLFFWK